MHYGTTTTSAFHTLKQAETQVQPGDTVLIGSGTYMDAETNNDGAVVSLSVSGKPGAWITWKALPGQHAASGYHNLFRHNVWNKGLVP